MPLKTDLISAHTAPNAYEGGAPNPVLADLNANIREALDESDEALAHQVAYFAERLKDYALKAKRRVQRAQNEKNDDFVAVLAELTETKRKLSEAEARLAAKA